MMSKIHRSHYLINFAPIGTQILMKRQSSLTPSSLTAPACIHTGPNFVPSTMSFPNDITGSGLSHRLSPTGECAYGILKYPSQYEPAMNSKNILLRVLLGHTDNKTDENSEDTDYGNLADYDISDLLWDTVYFLCKVYLKCFQ